MNQDNKEKCIFYRYLVPVSTIDCVCNTMMIKSYRFRFRSMDSLLLRRLLSLKIIVHAVVVAVIIAVVNVAVVAGENNQTSDDTTSTTSTCSNSNNNNNNTNNIYCSTNHLTRQYTKILDHVPSVTLNNGIQMPLLQLGTAQLITKIGIDSTVPERFTGMVPERTFRQIELALQNGIRAFDTAFIYRSHIPIGQVIGEWFRTGQLLHRNDIWIQTKIFHPNATQMTFGISHMPSLQQMSPQQVSKQTLEHIEISLLQLNIGYTDLLLLHWPSGLPESRTEDIGTGTTTTTTTTDNTETTNDNNWSLNNESNNRRRRIAAWKVLEQVYEKGWTRAIGVSNFSVKHLQQLVEDGATIIPMVNQIEASVTLQYTDIVQYCLDNNIIPQAYSPFGRGLTEMPIDVLSNMVKKYEKDDFGQISIKYLLQLGYSVVYLSNSPERMVSNMNVFDFNLTNSDMDILKQFHRPDGGWGLPSPNQLA